MRLAAWGGTLPRIVYWRDDMCAPTSLNPAMRALHVVWLFRCDGPFIKSLMKTVVAFLLALLWKQLHMAM